MTAVAADGRVSLTPEGRNELAQMLPSRFFGIDRVERAVLNNAEFTRTIDSALPKAIFVLLPLFALLTKLAWRRTLKTYPAHLYLALHLHAAWFAVVALITLLTAFASSSRVLAVAGILTAAYIVWYTLLVLRRVFEDSWVRTIGKAAAIGVVYVSALNAVSLIILSYAIVTA